VAKSDPAIDALASVDLFQGLTRKELTEVAGLLKPFRFRAGEALMEAGDRSGRFYLLTSGSAVVIVNGRRRLTIGPGDYVGEVAVIDEGPRTATVLAETDVETLSLASFNLRALLKTNATLSYKLLIETCKRLRAADANLFG
jgi:CRP/FNR family transcriptional regulator, cyclic AMP receptor protein